MTEEEEDEEYLKEEEDALAGAGGTRLVSQPSCEPFAYYLLLLHYFSCLNQLKFLKHFSFLVDGCFPLFSYKYLMLSQDE
jgi:hypothetical protein